MGYGKKNLRPKDKEKVDYGYLLDTQNGWAYGPVSIKGEKHQFFAPTTNFGMFHAAQPRAIHEFWGAAFTQGCPFGGMGGRRGRLFGGEEATKMMKTKAKTMAMTMPAQLLLV